MSDTEEDLRSSSSDLQTYQIDMAEAVAALEVITNVVIEGCGEHEGEVIVASLKPGDLRALRGAVRLVSSDWHSLDSVIDAASLSMRKASRS